MAAGVQRAWASPGFSQPVICPCFGVELQLSNNSSLEQQDTLLTPGLNLYPHDLLKKPVGTKTLRWVPPGGPRTQPPPLPPVLSYLIAALSRLLVAITNAKCPVATLYTLTVAL